MAVKLRTRLFLTVAIVLAVSIGASALLSRRATLVEVREVVARPVAASVDALIATGARVEKHMREQGAAGVEAILVAAGREHAHPFLLIDTARHIVSASTPGLRTARLDRATPDGELALEVESDGERSALAVRGPAAYPVRDRQGETVAWLYALPPDESRERAPKRPLVPSWIEATGAVAVIAIILAFAVSRRILRPVSALTAAAVRMQRGDFDVQVAVRGDDEIAGLSRAFNAMAAQIAETEKLRRQMVGDVAHELRSPVTNLRCGLEAIQDGLTVPDRAAIDALHEDAVFLQRLIADLQDLALAEAGRLDLALADVDVTQVIKRAVASMGVVAGAAISVATDSPLPIIHADADRLEQVLRNLLSNARRHTPADGAITVTASADREAVRITVTDNGCGIDPAHLPHVFDRFYRADRSRARATGGAGLGLAIARQLAAAHSGTIEASSAGTDRGATFVVTLPVRAFAV